MILNVILIALNSFSRTQQRELFDPCQKHVWRAQNCTYAVHIRTSDVIMVSVFVFWCVISHNQAAWAVNHSHNVIYQRPEANSFIYLFNGVVHAWPKCIDVKIRHGSALTFAIIIIEKALGVVCLCQATYLKPLGTSNEKIVLRTIRLCRGKLQLKISDSIMLKTWTVVNVCFLKLIGSQLQLNVPSQVPK